MGMVVSSCTDKGKELKATSARCLANYDVTCRPRLVSDTTCDSTLQFVRLIIRNRDCFLILELG